MLGRNENGAEISLRAAFLFSYAFAGMIYHTSYKTLPRCNLGSVSFAMLDKMYFKVIS